MTAGSTLLAFDETVFGSFRELYRLARQEVLI